MCRNSLSFFRKKKQQQNFNVVHVKHFCNQTPFNCGLRYRSVTSAVNNFKHDIIPFFMNIYLWMVNNTDSKMSKNIKKEQQDDDDWETDPDYVNDVSEQEQRWGGRKRDAGNFLIISNKKYLWFVKYKSWQYTFEVSLYYLCYRCYWYGSV